jgi:glyoxylase-like metal-dependent hydrolase (beta-lactamase superfamily II)
MASLITTQIGKFAVTALQDGNCHLPTMFYPGLDFTSHPELLHEDGTHHIPTGCFLVRGAGVTVLVDAGSGPDDLPFPPDLADAAGLANPPEHIATSGGLPAQLAEAGVSPEDVTTIFLTHLHYDHVGWVAPRGQLFFPNAEVYYGEADWAALIDSASEKDPARQVMEAARDAGVLRPVSSAEVEIAPGITALHTPGHTPGHYVVRVTDGDQSAFLTGDAVHHPMQVTHSGISFLTDADPTLAAEARHQLLQEVEVSQAVFAADHFPGLGFHRVEASANSRWSLT